MACIQDLKINIHHLASCLIVRKKMVTVREIFTVLPLLKFCLLWRWAKKRFSRRNSLLSIWPVTFLFLQKNLHWRMEKEDMLSHSLFFFSSQLFYEKTEGCKVT